MSLLLDTHVLLWAAAEPHRLPAAVRAEIEAPATTPLFSAASLWEVAIKASLGRADFTVSAARLRRGLLENGYAELPVTGRHAAAVASLPDLHRDPFDRMLVAQAQVEGVTLVTADSVLGGYPGPIRVI